MLVLNLMLLFRSCRSSLLRLLLPFSFSGLHYFPHLPHSPAVQPHYVAVLSFLICFAVAPRGSSQESATVMLSAVSTNIEMASALHVHNPIKKMIVQIVKDPINSSRGSPQGPRSPVFQLSLWP